MLADIDTIFALSSAPGRAGVSVFRLSGPQSQSALEKMTQKKTPTARQAVLRKLYDVSGNVLDHPLIFWFPAPKSFTGQDCAEFHVHGSLAVIEGVAEALLALGLRQARAGEFTRRAVENNKMDLTEAEGLADLIDAQTDGQRRQALQHMDGSLRHIYEAWRELLLDAMAQIEGEIDFADEGDVPDALSHAAYPYLRDCAKDMRISLSEMGRGQAIRSGLDIAIIGLPNAGKSTLMNHLARREVAITSPEAGTTRDIIEASVSLAGLPVTISDMAGLRDTDNVIEAEGVKRALKRGDDAHIRLFILRPELDLDLEAQLISLSVKFKPDDIIYINKSDTYDENNFNFNDKHCVVGSALKGESTDNLLSHFEELIADKYTQGGAAGLTRQRHADCVRKALSGTERAMNNLGDAPELASDDIRLSLQALEELAGRADIEQVFDRIFSRFCIGK
ncbi:MAG: tRNA uridine-5-carboxymethylaminomethyl(34) synthesis GTPase MnmE [Litorimonas sp.]